MPDVPIQLEKEGVVLLNERITQAVKARITQAVLAVTLSQQKSLLILIDCTGGEVEAALQIYDVIRCSALDSVGIVVGECSSSAMVLLQACKKRYALPHARFMCHTLSFTFKSSIAVESIEGFRIALAERMQISKHFDDLLCSRGIPAEVLQRLKREGDIGTLFPTESGDQGWLFYRRRNSRFFALHPDARGDLSRLFFILDLR